MDPAQLLFDLVRKPGCAFYIDGAVGNMQLVESLPKNCDYDVESLETEQQDFINIALSHGFNAGDKIWIEFCFEKDWYENYQLVMRGGFFPDKLNVNLSKLLNLKVDFDGTILKLM